MPFRSLNDAIFRLGRISASGGLTNPTLLRQLTEVTAETLGSDIALLSVFECGVESPSTCSCVRGPWTDNDRDRFFEQSGLRIDDGALARRLAGMRRGRLYHRPELGIAERETRTSRLEGEFRRATQGDQALALFRRSDGVELLFGICAIDSTFQRAMLARAGALAPYVAHCWASGYRREPGWMASLKPQGRLILEQLLQGFDDDQIAERTGLSYHSVRAHLKRLFRDAGVRSRLHLMQACRQPVETQLVVEAVSEDSAQPAFG
ncbi:MAG: helix-turn-helix transcriptional regulator [Planctomycetota bacterium]|nr:helix-turn-helix transcriptional regulator [Planctomycetota bacterium]